MSYLMRWREWHETVRCSSFSATAGALPSVCQNPECDWEQHLSSRNVFSSEITVLGGKLLKATEMQIVSHNCFLTLKTSQMTNGTHKWHMCVWSISILTMDIQLQQDNPSFSVCHWRVTSWQQIWSLLLTTFLSFPSKRNPEGIKWSRENERLSRHCHSLVWLPYFYGNTECDQSRGMNVEISVYCDVNYIIVPCKESSTFNAVLKLSNT